MTEQEKVFTTGGTGSHRVIQRDGWRLSSGWPWESVKLGCEAEKCGFCGLWKMLSRGWRVGFGIKLLIPWGKYFS